MHVVIVRFVFHLHYIYLTNAFTVAILFNSEIFKKYIFRHFEFALYLLKCIISYMYHYKKNPQVQTPKLVLDIKCLSLERINQTCLFLLRPFICFFLTINLQKVRSLLSCKGFYARLSYQDDYLRRSSKNVLFSIKVRTL